jgi:hypothetical protein
VSASGSYLAAFVVAAVTLLGAAACYGFLLPRTENEATASLSTT